MNTTELRDLVEQRLDVRWNDFTEEHPNLAAAIDRIKLVETSVEQLLDDPAYQDAMSAAVRDETTIGAAGQIIDLIDRWVNRLLGI